MKKIIYWSFHIIISISIAILTLILEWSDILPNHGSLYVVLATGGIYWTIILRRFDDPDYQMGLIFSFFSFSFLAYLFIGLGGEPLAKKLGLSFEDIRGEYVEINDPSNSVIIEGKSRNELFMKVGGENHTIGIRGYELICHTYEDTLTVFKEYHENCTCLKIIGALNGERIAIKKCVYFDPSFQLLPNQY